MRRAWGMLPLLLVLLGAAVQAPSALAVDGDDETLFVIPLQAGHGLSAKLEADDDEIELLVTKGSQQALYSAEGKVGPESIEVQFGDFGEFNVAYQPFRTLEERGPYRHCKGEPNTTTEGFFRGTLDFRGEGGYFHVDATRIKGTRALRHEWECDRPGAAARAARVKHRNLNVASLGAWSRTDRLVGFAVFGQRDGKNAGSYFFAQSQEVRRKVAIIRFTFAGSRGRDFRFDHRRGTAFVDPPAPFAGSARFKRRHGTRGDWKGDLTAPLLGLGRVRLAGPTFKARLEPKLPRFE